MKKYVAQTLLSVPAFVTITIEHRQECAVPHLRVS
jgi:hypothetical protein